MALLCCQVKVSHSSMLPFFPLCPFCVGFFFFQAGAPSVVLLQAKFHIDATHTHTHSHRAAHTPHLLKLSRKSELTCVSAIFTMRHLSIIHVVEIEMYESFTNYVSQFLC